MDNKEIILELSKRLGSSHEEVSKMIACTSNVIVSNLKSGNMVSIQGFGVFEPRKKQERNIINPSTKETMTIEAKNVVKFKAGAELSDKINKK